MTVGRILAAVAVVVVVVGLAATTWIVAVPRPMAFAPGSKVALSAYRGADPGLPPRGDPVSMLVHGGF